MLADYDNKGSYDFLSHKRHEKLSRQISLSYKYQRSSLYRYSLILVSFLENKYFARGISLGSIVEETDISWVAKDYCAEFTVVSKMKLTPGHTGSEVKYVFADPRTVEYEGMYDLVIVIGESAGILHDMDFYSDFVRNHTYTGADIVFMVRFYPPDRYIDKVPQEALHADLFVKRLPYRVRSKFVFNIDQENNSYTDYFFLIDKP